MTCKNAGREDLNLARTKVPEWIGIYLSDARVRLQAQVRRARARARLKVGDRADASVAG